MAVRDAPALATGRPDARRRRRPHRHRAGPRGRGKHLARGRWEHGRHARRGGGRRRPAARRQVRTGRQHLHRRLPAGGGGPSGRPAGDDALGARPRAAAALPRRDGGGGPHLRSADGPVLDLGGRHRGHRPSAGADRGRTTGPPWPARCARRNSSSSITAGRAGSRSSPPCRRWSPSPTACAWRSPSRASTWPSRCRWSA